MRWWNVRSHQGAAATAYAFADDKPAYLQADAPPPPSCTTRVKDTALAVRAAARAALGKLVCFRSYWYSIPLGIASVGLAIACYVMLLVVDADTMNARYGFTLLPAKSYSKWGLAMYIMMPMLCMPPLTALCLSAERSARWIMYFVSAIYVTMLVIGNALSVSRTSSRRVAEPQFAAQFNAFYCNARLVHACLENKEDDVLVLAGIGNATALNAATNATDGVLSVFTHCSDALLTSVHRDAQSIVEDPDVYVPVAWINDLLDDHKTSQATDAWCSQLGLQTTPLPDAEQRAPPSPYASSPDLFAAYVDEWPRRMWYTNVLLGSSVGCMLLAAASWKIKDVTRQSGWQW